MTQGMSRAHLYFLLPLTSEDWLRGDTISLASLWLVVLWPSRIALLWPEKEYLNLRVWWIGELLWYLLALWGSLSHSGARGLLLVVWHRRDSSNAFQMGICRGGKHQVQNAGDVIYKSFFWGFTSVYSIETVFHSLSFSVRKPLLKMFADHSATIKKALTNKKPRDSLNYIYSAQMFVQSISFDVQTTREPQTTLCCSCSAHVHLNTAVSGARTSQW